MLEEWEKFERPLIERIDKVLYMLRDNIDGLTKAEIFDRLIKDKVTITHPELTALLEKLVKDEYAVYEVLLRSVERVEGYKITYDGLIFAYQSGYFGVEWIKERNWEMTRQLEKSNTGLQKTQTQMIAAQADIMKEQTLIQDRVRKLTFWIAAGTIIAAVYYLVQLGDYIKKLFFHCTY